MAEISSALCPRNKTTGSTRFNLHKNKGEKVKKRPKDSVDTSHATVSIDMSTEIFQHCSGQMIKFISSNNYLSNLDKFFH